MQPVNPGSSSSSRWQELSVRTSRLTHPRPALRQGRLADENYHQQCQGGSAAVEFPQVLDIQHVGATSVARRARPQREWLGGFSKLAKPLPLCRAIKFQPDVARIASASLAGPGGRNFDKLAAASSEAGGD